MLKTEMIGSYTDPRWMDFISKHDQATIFHHPDWIKTIGSTYGFQSASLGVVGDNRLVGILPLLDIRSRITGKRGVCLPFSDVCVPLFESTDAAEVLLSSCPGLLKQYGWKYIEFRGGTSYPGMMPTTHFKYHRVMLNEESDVVLHSFRKNMVRKAINKATRSGLCVERRQDINALQEFIRLNELTRRKNGVPPQPEQFFFNLHENLIKANRGFINLVMLGKNAVAAGLFLHFKDTLYHKYTGVDRRYLPLRPINMLVWEAMKWGCENGFRIFDFGRTDCENQGLLEFKRSWSPQETDLVYHRLCMKSGSSMRSGKELSDVAGPLFKVMPIAVLRLIGRVFYRHAA
jgi:CelD/BcsL family acetyltransferase involved in cellulose biosynthesis